MDAFWLCISQWRCSLTSFEQSVGGVFSVTCSRWYSSWWRNIAPLHWLWVWFSSGSNIRPQFPQKNRLFRKYAPPSTFLDALSCQLQRQLWFPSVFMATSKRDASDKWSRRWSHLSWGQWSTLPEVWGVGGTSRFRGKDSLTSGVRGGVRYTIFGGRGGSTSKEAQQAQFNEFTVTNTVILSLSNIWGELLQCANAVSIKTCVNSPLADSHSQIWTKMKRWKQLKQTKLSFYERESER